MARNRDWVPCQAWGQGITVAPQDTVDVVLVAPRDITLPNLAAVAPTEVAVVETESEVATTRVVGQAFVIGGDQQNLYIERIRVGLFDNAGAFAFFANSFLDGEDANEPFLWQRIGTTGGGSDANAGWLVHPYWSLIDLRVGRRLRQDQALFYSIFNNAAVGGDALTLRLFLRTLARQA